MPLVVPSTVPVRVLHALSIINNAKIRVIFKSRITCKIYHNYIVLTLPIILKFLSEIIISPEDEPVFKIDEITT